MSVQQMQSFDEYVNLLIHTGIVEKERLGSILEEFLQDSSGQDISLDFLIKRLLEEKLITEWQNRHLRKGRSKGFFLGKYKLLDYISAGGMSVVYQAEHVLMRRKVAIKVLQQLEVDHVTVERFRRECQAVASLNHPNIVRAHDFDTDGKYHYLVMEYVEGSSLQSYISKNGPIDHITTADFISQAARGLLSAHQAGMVHRDIKPSNLLCDVENVIKVLDLGIARITTTDDSLTLASDQTLLGTLDYLAPEQAMNSHNVDVRADVYSLGCTMYFLLAGHPPFPDGHQTQKLLAHQLQQPTPLSEKRSDLPEDFVAVCTKMMAKRPEDRPQTMEEVCELLEPWTEGSIATHKSVLDVKQASSSAADTRSDSPQPTVSEHATYIKISCKGCNTQYQVNSKAANRRALCPKCGHQIFIHHANEITCE